MSVGWVKSSESIGNGQCVEVADLRDGIVGVRNIRHADMGGPILAFTGDEWRAFIKGARNGEFDKFGGTE